MLCGSKLTYSTKVMNMSTGYDIFMFVIMQIDAFEAVCYFVCAIWASIVFNSVVFFRVL